MDEPINIITKKQRCDFIKEDDEYMNEKFKDIWQEWKDRAREDADKEEITSGGVNYETLYKYNLIATKE